MSKFVRYICNKKNEPVYRKDCVGCPEYNPCAVDGKWCFVGALIMECDPICKEAVQHSSKNAAAPIMRDMSTVTINLGDGAAIDVLREDIKRQLEEDFYKKAGLYFGT